MTTVKTIIAKKLILALFVGLFAINTFYSAVFAQRGPLPDKKEKTQEKPKKEDKKKAEEDEDKKGEEAADAAENVTEVPENTDVLNLSPALWKIENADTTVYFLGTVHVLPDNVNWVTQEILDAFSKSENLILETDPNIDDSKTIPFFVQQNGMYASKSKLKRVLGKELYAAYEARWAESGLPPAMKDGLKPWYASIVLTGQYLQTLNLKPENGVESILTNQARMNGIALRGLETPFDQLSAFANLPEKTQIELLENSISQLDEAGATWQRIVTAWGSGHEANMKVRLLDEMRKTPDLFKALIIDRNRNWIPTLEVILREKGTHFVAVGAAHLVGDYSIFEMLKMKGYRAFRVK